MIRSMTGFATQSVSLTLDGGDKIAVTLSIKSLNCRFFETNCRFPFAFSNLETDIIKLLKKHLFRGYVYFSITTPDQSLFTGGISPALSVAQSYLQAIDQIQKQCDITGTIDIKDLINLPNIFIAHEQTVTEESKNTLLSFVESLTFQLIAEQEKEGAVLLTDLKKRIALINGEMPLIEKEAAQLMEEKKKQLNQELRAIETDENKLLELHKSALYLILDKIDIHEEITRFKSHIANLEQQLASSTIEKGKKLDFTLQELSREINTIAAKCSHASISSHAINIKVELEKVREQIQNIV